MQSYQIPFPELTKVTISTDFKHWTVMCLEKASCASSVIINVFLIVSHVMSNLLLKLYFITWISVLGLDLSDAIGFLVSGTKMKVKLQDVKNNLKFNTGGSGKDLKPTSSIRLLPALDDLKGLSIRIDLHPIPSWWRLWRWLCLCVNEVLDMDQPMKYVTTRSDALHNWDRSLVVKGDIQVLYKS